jgi:hypothetical protein
VVEVLPKDFKEFDIIFGREGNSNGLPGNIRFRGIVEAKKARLRNNPRQGCICRTASLCTSVPSMVVSSRKDRIENSWIVMTDVEAIRETNVRHSRTSNPKG